MGAVTLTDRQQEAKENMENSLRFTPRWNFQSYDDFNDYMAFLIKRIKKKNNLAKAVSSWKISYAEINEKARANKLKYYNRFDNLKKYWSNYSWRYFPSYNKLVLKLKEKSKNEELSYKVADYLLENKIIESDKELATKYFQWYLYQWKNYNKIRILLTKKLFDKNLIDELIDTSKESVEGSLLDPFTLTIKIENLLKQWKSEYYILNKFWDTNYDRDLIYEIFEELNFDNTEIMMKELKKFKNQWLEKQKIIARMFSRWFNYDDFKYYLDEETYE